MTKTKNMITNLSILNLVQFKTHPNPSTTEEFLQAYQNLYYDLQLFLYLIS